MCVIYLANVGTRDVVKVEDGKSLSISQKYPDGSVGPDCRVYGKEWLDHYQSIADHLDAPILLKGLRYVCGQLEQDHDIKVLLFYSDQDKEGDEVKIDKQWAADTLYFAEILKKLLPERLPKQIRDVQIVKLGGNPVNPACGGNPANYNRMFPFFKLFFQGQLPPDLATEKVEKAYVAPVGGADASNLCLLMNAVRYYWDTCQFIYVMEGGEVFSLNLSREILSEYARQEAKAHLERHDYAALKTTLKRAELGQDWHYSLCDYADRRMRFDFARAKINIDAAIVNSYDNRVLQELAESLSPFLRTQAPPTSRQIDHDVWDGWFALQRHLLVELFFNLSLKSKQGEWVDFLGRLSRMREAILEYVFEFETQHTVSDSRDYYNAFSDEPALNGFRYDRGAYPNITETLWQVLQYWVEENVKDYSTLLSILRIVESQTLKDLRNDSIIAHGYHGISKEDVEKTSARSVECLMQYLRDALQEVSVDIDSAADPYATVQSLLSEALNLPV